MTVSTRGYRLPKNGEWIMRDGWTWPDQPCRKGHTVVSMRANRIKNDATIDELRIIADFYGKLATKD